MDRRISSLLGMLDSGKRIYHIIQSEEVSQEEFQVSQVIDQVVFGEKGYVQSLGPTWAMIHDPRFMNIENVFIVDRPGRLGGDQSTGYQKISGDGTPLASSMVDLEQYAEILGEGRTLHWAVSHPNPKCPVRLMLETFRTINEVKAVPESLCQCAMAHIKYDPKKVKDLDEVTLWQILKHEYPNWFAPKGSFPKVRLEQLGPILKKGSFDLTQFFASIGLPNNDAARLYRLIRADLVGLIDDYAEVPFTKEWVHMDTEDIASADQLLDPEFPGAFLEVIWLEKALSYRTQLRVTAYKILKGLDFEGLLKSFSGDDFKKLELTDVERDQVLRIIYDSKYPEEKALMIANLMNFVIQVSKTPIEERMKWQVERDSAYAKEMVGKIRSGEIKPIDRHSDGVVDAPDAVVDSETGETDMMGVYFKAIMDDPRKMALYVNMAEAERGIEEIDKELDSLAGSTAEITSQERIKFLTEDRALLDAVVHIIKPVLSNPTAIVDEDKYSEVVDAVNKLGYKKSTVGKTVEGEL